MDIDRPGVKTERIFYQGVCPEIYRVLPFVPKKYLKNNSGYMFQKVPKNVNMLMADVLRGITKLSDCYVYDLQKYCHYKTFDDGKIYQTFSGDIDGCDGIHGYLHSLLSKEDWDRIEKYKKGEIKWQVEE